MLLYHHESPSILSFCHWFTILLQIVKKCSWAASAVILTPNADDFAATTKGFATELEVEKFFERDISKREFPMTVIFKDVESATSWPTHVIYKLRPQIGKQEDWLSERLFPALQKIIPRLDLTERKVATWKYWSNICWLIATRIHTCPSERL